MTPPVNTRIFRVSLTRWEALELYLEAECQEDAEAQAENILIDEGIEPFCPVADGLTRLSVDEMTGEAGE